MPTSSRELAPSMKGGGGESAAASASLGAPLYLYAGSRFSGLQCGQHSSYGIEVEIQSVDLDHSTLCGYLSISGLTAANPVITTFFEAEIIGPRYPFLTSRWEASEEVDHEHWSRVAGHGLRSLGRIKNWPLPDEQSEFILMRWKEQFLVPDHRVRSIAGASFAGFYYVSLHKQSGTIYGLYYHRNSELYQSLSLKHCATRSVSEFQFR